MEPFAERRVCIPATLTAPDGVRHAPAVLVALADPDLRAAVSRILARQNYRVLTARHSGHALLACLTGGRIDILVADLRMEDDSGPALAERLRRHSPDLRAVYVSTNPLDGAADVLVGRSTADDLVRAIHSRSGR